MYGREKRFLPGFSTLSAFPFAAVTFPPRPGDGRVREYTARHGTTRHDTTDTKPPLLLTRHSPASVSRVCKRHPTEIRTSEITEACTLFVSHHHHHYCRRQSGMQLRIIFFFPARSPRVLSISCETILVRLVRTWHRRRRRSDLHFEQAIDRVASATIVYRLADLTLPHSRSRVQSGRRL